MTVENETTRVIVLGNGVTTVFSYTFPIPGSSGTDQTNAELILTDTASVSTTLANNLWSMTGVDTGVGGTFTYPLSGSPITTGSTLTLVRIVPFEQTTSLSAQGAYSPEIVEAALDNIVEQTEQLNVRELQNLRAPITEVALIDLPAAAIRASKFLAFDNSGQPMVLGNTSGGGGVGGVVLAAGTRSISTGTAIFSNLNGVSWGFNGQTISASINALGLNTAGSNITWTANSSGLSIDARNYAGTVTAVTNATVTLNSAGLSISVAAPGAATNAVGLGTAQSNVTWTVNTNGISLDARGYAGTGFSGTNISGTHNSLGIQLSVAAPGGGGGITASAYANFVGGISQSNGAFLQNSYSQAVSFNLPYYLSASYLRLAATFADQSTTIATTGQSMSASAEAYSTYNAVVYSMGTGASSRSLISVASGSGGWTQRNSVSIAANGTQGSYTQAMTYQIEGNSSSISTQYSVSATNYPFSSTLFSGCSSVRYLDIPFANSLSPGPYWLVVGLKTANATNSVGMNEATRCSVGYSRHYVFIQANSNILTMGGPNTPLGEYGGGVFTTNAAATTSIFASSAINNENGLAILWFQMMRSA